MPSSNHAGKSSSTWLIILVVIIALALSVSVYLLSHQSKKTAGNVPLTTLPRTTTPRQATQSAAITSEEKIKMDEWIEKNNLNVYGDPKDTAYAGGTPLFDETTGETVDRYMYILKNHPEKPWNK